MVHHWIFVLYPFSDFSRGNADETLLKLKMSNKWPVGKRTPNRKDLSKGDKALFYLAGKDGQKFIGSAELLSDLQISENNYCDFVVLKTMKLWKNPTFIKELVNSLSFISNKNHYGCSLQGGIVKIPESDYALISSKAKK